MSAFLEIKDALPARRVLEHYIGPARKNWPCPFHPDKTPSLTAYGPAIRCFGCHWKGDIFGFVESFTGVSRGEALTVLADLAGVILPELPKGKKRPPGPSPAQVMRQVRRETAQSFADIIRQIDIEAARLWRQAWAERETDAVWDVVADGAELDREIALSREGA